MIKKVFFLNMILLFISFNAAGQDINYAEALQKSIYFYDANMCGPGAGEASRLEWRGDCHVWDAEAPHPSGSGTLDVRGGFHDCGDHVKFGQPQVYAIATLGWGYYEFKEAFASTGQEDHILDVLKWGTDYLLRSTVLNSGGEAEYFVYMVGKGASDHVVWIPPELQTMAMDARPLTWASAATPAAETAGGAAAALALMYLNYGDIDASYAEKCLTYAKALYKLGRKYPGTGTGEGFYNPLDYDDDMTWAATWLYVATGNMSYIDHITETDSNGIYTGYVKEILSSTSDTWQNVWVHCWDATWGGAFTKLATLFPEREDFSFWGLWNLEYWTGGAVQHADGSGNYLQPTAAGYAMINTWGSARYNTAAQLCMLVYNKYIPSPGLVDWARGQMEYILGDNPMGYSYMVGYPSPEDSALRPHHRAAHGSQTNDMGDPDLPRHVLWGALVGGPDGSDYHEDVTSDYVYNEVGVDYNAAVVGALAGHYLISGSGDKPLANFPPSEGDVREYYIEGKVEQDNTQRTQITLQIHSESVHPPHYQPNVGCRFYFNISELQAKGQDIGDVSMQVMYDEMSISGKGKVSASGPTAYDSANGIYYIDFLWEYEGWYGDLELLFALVATQDSSYQENWDSSNDYSREGLSSSYSITEKVPVYVEGRHVFGTGYGGETPEPPEATPPVINPTPTPDVGMCGDVNGNGQTDIVDALMIAQFYVGLNPAGFNVLNGDVNNSGDITIVDALMVAQYYVGLLQTLCN